VFVLIATLFFITDSVDFNTNYLVEIIVKSVSVSAVYIILIYAMGISNEINSVIKKILSKFSF
jgi:hypothetical protein